MNHEGYSPMHVESEDISLGLGLGLEENLLSSKAARADDAKMDGEGKKSGGSNRKTKLQQQQVELQPESDDDEPIGSLFKLKKHRNPKRVKSVVSDGAKVEKVRAEEAASDGGKVKKARAQKLIAKDDGEMEDTLASLRKKLKGPKVSKDGGGRSVAGKGKSLASTSHVFSKEEEEIPTCSGGDDSTLLLDLRSDGKLKSWGKKSKVSKMGKDGGSGKGKRSASSVAGFILKQVEESPTSNGGGLDSSKNVGSFDMPKRRGRPPKYLKVGKDGGPDTGKVRDPVAGLRLEQVEERPVHSGDGSDLLSDVVSADMQKHRRKRSRLATMLKKKEEHSEIGDALDQPSGDKGYQETLAKEHKEKPSVVGETDNHSSDENLEFSLSDFIRKSQSGSGAIKKARSLSIRKKRKVSPVSGDRLGSQSSEGSLEDVAPTLTGELHSNPIEATKICKSDAVLDSESGGSLITPSFVEENGEAQRPDEKPSQSSCWVQENTMSSTTQELPPLPKIDEEVVKCTDDRRNGPPEEILQQSASPSSPPKSHSDFVTELKENPGAPTDIERGRCNTSSEGTFEDPDLKSPVPGLHSCSPKDDNENSALRSENDFDEQQIVSPGNQDILHQPRGPEPEDLASIQVHEPCSVAVQKLMAETQSFINGLKQCSNGDVNKLPANDDPLNEESGKTSQNVLPSIALTSGQGNEISDEVTPDSYGAQTISTEVLGFISSLGQSSSGVPLVLSSSLIEDSFASSEMPKNETVVPHVNDDLLEGKCDENHNCNCLGVGEPSKILCLELSGVKPSSMPSKKESEDIARYDEVAHPFGEGLEDSLLHTVGNFSSVSDPKAEEVSRAEGLVQASDECLDASQNQPSSCIPDPMKKDETGTGSRDPFQAVDTSMEESHIPLVLIRGEEAIRSDDVAEPFGEEMEDSLMHTVQNFSSVCDSLKMEEDSKLEGLVQSSDECLDGSQYQPSSCSPGQLKKDETGTEIDCHYQSIDTPVEESYIAAVPNRAGESIRSDDGLHPVFSIDDITKISDFCSPLNQEDSIAIVDASNQLSDEILPVYSASPQYKQPDYDTLKVSANLQSVNLEPETLADDAGKAMDLEIIDRKILPVQRAVRKIKKRRHGDMAYEGDTDWDFLIHGQGFFENSHAFDGDRPSRTRNKFDCPLNMGVEGDNFGTAAVAAGLKTRAAGPYEKVRFKDVLKRRGGLQEYLECRNLILGLWSKDMCRVLPLSDCGVTDAPSDDEPPRVSLIRDIYAFLNHNGYINVGIAYEKEKREPDDDEVQYRLSSRSTAKGSSGTQVVDSEDGVTFIFGQVRSSENLTEGKKDMLVNNDKPISEATKNKKLIVTSTGSELSTLVESDECVVNNELENGWFDAKLSNRLTNMDVLTNLSSEVMDDGPDSFGGSEQIRDSSGIQSTVVDPVEGKSDVECNLKIKRKIIVIGAGPAGLTAARHMQRQGFSVTILEARDRLGGRVYTDRSSLSVPVDLGASIITGVEADVATERRPDPSSLICSQLGLELTVLNSDCPLYDIVTGQKVPAELDEALEAEYNSLLDETVYLVAQKGDRAMRMSLEDGLEYALKKRRMGRSIPESEEFELNTSVNACFDTGAHGKGSSKEALLSPLERRVMNWHFANLEYGCAAQLKKVSLPYWNQDDVYGGFGGAHCMIKGGYSNVVESLGKGLQIYLNQAVTEVSYSLKESGETDEQHSKVKISTSNGSEFLGDAVLVTVPLGCLKANTIKFSPSLPEWKQSSIRQLGFGVLNKVVLQFPEVFWDDSVDYFGATAEQTDQRGQCFMFWNVKKTVGAPVLIALVVGKAAIDGESMTSSDHVNHALKVLRRLFGDASVPDPVASVVTNWGQDPYSRGAYSYVAVGSSGEDYDILGRPVENCLFFAGEATCKEHPDTVGGAMMSGLREAVRIIDILNTGDDHMAEVEAMEAAQQQSKNERNEVRDILKRLEAVELSNVLCKSSLDGDQMLTKEALLQDMFCNAKSTAGRLPLAKKLLNLPVEVLKSFAGTKEGLGILNSWILDSMGKDGTQLLRHCVRLLVLVSTDLLAVRLSGIGRTVKEKVCVHTSRDIRAVASQLVSMWIEVFRKEKATSGGLKLLRQASASDSFKSKSPKDVTSGKLLRTTQNATHNRGNMHYPSSPRKNSPSNNKKTNAKPVKLETVMDAKADRLQLHSQVVETRDSKSEDNNVIMSEEEVAALAAAEAARAAALAAAEAYASKEAECSTLRDLPKIPSFHKFARREQYAQMDDSDLRRKWSGGVLGRQDCLSDIDSRNCKVRNWSVDFSAACANLDSSRMSGDNYTQHSYSNEVTHQVNLREHSGESVATDSRLTKAWVDSAGSGGVKDYHAIERWQSQAAAADSDYFHSTLHIRDEEDSNTASKSLISKNGRKTEESSASQATDNQEVVENQVRGVERIKKAVVDYVGSLLMPLYKARKIDKEGYKSIMKKSATKVMEQTTDAEKIMTASEFLDFKRKNKIRAFVDKLIEKHMAMTPVDKP